MYEGVTRVPLLVQYPNSFRGRTVEDCVSLVDLLPTVLDYAGIPDTLRRDGISLKPLLEEERKLRRPGVRIEYKEEPDRIRYKAWVTPEWKLAVYLGESFGELYDLKNDPEEKINRFGDPNYGAVQLRLMTELLNDLERSEPVSGRESRV
ncbi:DUF4976 domain-containing protein [Paenibacillus sp. CC-CFT747]|nr:DUF4976 domain-containing protein [Paenibacillus sp. CC-CFT747]